MTISKQDILNAYHYRHACKVYDPNKKISDDDFRVIMETARLSPSSFGFEPWRFLVIENRAIREAIRDMAWGAKDKIMDCSHFVVILVRHGETLLADGEYVQHMMHNVHRFPEEAITLRRNFYRHFSEQDFALTQEPAAFYHWACRQSYIALGNMMTTAAMLGIDSTAIEGFPLEKTDALLVEKGLYDPKEFKLSVMVAFGYRVAEPREKTRQAFEDVVQWMK